MKGDSSDFAAFLRVLLPKRWFSDTTPVLDGVLAGFAGPWATAWSNLAYAQAASRLATAPGEWLDLAAQDFLGGLIARKPGQGDAAFSLRLRKEIVRQRATRAGLIQALTDLTGRAPQVFEPALATDTGGYGSSGMTTGTGLAYAGSGAAGAGGYGSLALPFQCFITARRATGGGIANVAGYYAGSGSAAGGYGTGAIEYGQLSMSQGQVTDADIYAQAAAIMPAATTGWMSITN